MRVAVEAWAPEYGNPVEEGASAPSTVDVAVEVEAAPADWGPRTPPAGTSTPSVVAFVDGVRRVDAQVWVTGDDEVTRPGICATWAAGVVRCSGDPASAAVVTAEVRRGLFTPAPGATDLWTRHAAYRAVRTTGDQPDQLSLALQSGMAQLEHEVSQSAGAGAVGATPDLVIVDGPLRDRQRLPAAVGYVKTHHAGYLPEAVAPVVAALVPGQRTPVFQIGGRWGRWSWYLRLPCRMEHDWSGVVRCEASLDVALADALGLADRVTSALPRFASTPEKDPRAPQNLHPIAGLERALRRRLGDPALLLRSLREAAASGWSAAPLPVGGR